MTLLELLEYAYLAPFTTKSDFSRAHADLIANAAVVGFLTTEAPREGFTSVWRLTPDGMIAMWASQPCDCSDCQQAESGELPGEFPLETQH